MTTSACDFSADDIPGQPQSLSQYAGKVLIEEVLG